MALELPALAIRLELAPPAPPVAVLVPPVARLLPLPLTVPVALPLLVKDPPVARDALLPLPETVLPELPLPVTDPPVAADLVLAFEEEPEVELEGVLREVLLLMLLLTVGLETELD